ncbi:cellulose synthase-like protein H1 isoform X2 [Neltuma alba]|uniref:cellulose synthase-like protein H1 isoform X2 n=1 Tax=Neltuma alba TaxID=207710 RepID=UPI0010A3316A|nr:cellulose synthase-like protein H1 isoform X2 [Prosopis alba]
MEDVQLYEKIWLKRRFQRVMDSFIFFLLLSLLGHRLITLSTHFTVPRFLAFLCESWFAFNWFIILSTKWAAARIDTFLHSLSQRVPKVELPAVDLLVTTADPVLEPPIITVNTVLSLLALDYPPHKLACYVSDDGCSPVNFYALVEASRFAKLWVPFCKKYNVQHRAPHRFFSAEPNGAQRRHSQEFTQDSLLMKEEYEKLSRKIEDVSRKPEQIKLEGEFAAFRNAERRNHQAIIKVIIWENKEGQSGGLPHLIYVSREKRPQHPHHHKAGAMNVLTRVSGLMSNAPYMLNIDCDMMVSNPKIAQHAMCIFLDPKGHEEVAFVQCFQQFYDGLKDDPFGNQLVAASSYVLVGLAGLQGPFYCGTNCFHRRKVIYGRYPDNTQLQNQDKKLEQKFGSSKEFFKLAAQAWEDNPCSSCSNVITPSTSLEAAIQVSSCEYEYGTAWGKQVGWLYGSLAEDQQTGLSIHRRGWRSECCTPEPIAFTGCAPGDLISSMVQQKRWASGLLRVFLGPQSPYLGLLFGKLQLRQCLGYLYLIHWGLHAFPETCYAAVPAYCLITNSTFLPKEPWLWIYVSVFVIYCVYSLIEYLAIGLSVRTWWNNQRMRRVMAMTAWFVGSLSAIVEMLGASNTVFDITQKEPPTCSASDTNAGRFIFDESPMFVPGTTMLLVQLTALAMKLLRLDPSAEKNGNGSGVGEVLCSVYLVVCLWPFLKGLFRKAQYGIPMSTIFKSAILAFLFVHCSISVTATIN